MSRSLWIGVIITVLLIGSLSFLFYYNYIKNISQPLDNAIPNHAAFYIETDNFSASWSDIYQSDMWKKLSENEEIAKLTNDIIAIESNLNENDYLSQFISGNKMAVSFHSVNKKINMLFVAKIHEDEGYMVAFDALAKKYGFSISTRTYLKQTIIDLSGPNRKTICSITKFKDFLICSSTGSLVEDAIEKLTYQFYGEWKNLSKAQTLAANAATFHVYINYAKISDFMQCFTNEQPSEYLNLIRNFASWSMFEVQVDNKHTQISGVTITDDSISQFLDVFNAQKPVETRYLENYLPYNTASYLQFGIHQYGKFYTDMYEYLSYTKQLDSITLFRDSLEKLYDYQLSNILPALGKHAALVYTECSPEQISLHTSAFISLANSQEFKNQFRQFNMRIQGRIEADSMHRNEFYKSYELSYLKAGNFLKIFYGKMFSGIYNPYYTVINDVCIFSNDINELKRIIDSYESKHTIASNVQYQQSNKQFSSLSNISIYINTTFSYPQFQQMANAEMFSLLNRASLDIKRFTSLQLQYASTNDKTFYSQLNIEYSPAYEEDNSEKWRLKLDTGLNMQPQFVKSNDSTENHILVQDINRNLYYISHTGELKWKIKLSSTITSNIYSVMHQHKIGYLFHSENTLFLIDERGLQFPGYPLKIQGKITGKICLNKINDSTFNYYIAVNNKSIQAYNQNGKPLRGWNTVSTNMYGDPSIFRSRLKTYLYYRNVDQSIHVLDSTGKLSAKIDPDSIPQFSSRIYSTTADFYIWNVDTGLQIQLKKCDSLFNIISENNLGKLTHTNQVFFDDSLILIYSDKGINTYHYSGLLEENYSDIEFDSLVRPYFYRFVDGRYVLGYYQQSKKLIENLNMNGNKLKRKKIISSRNYNINSSKSAGIFHFCTVDEFGQMIFYEIK